MPRILNGLELKEAIKWMGEAIKESQNAKCSKDKRGVVIVKNDKIIGKGTNSPPQGFECVPEYCMPICRTYAVHAEMNAIADAVKKGNNLTDARMYHARVENDQLANSRKPRCVDCSKHLITFGISEMVLKHEEGYVAYGVEEYHRLSLQSLKR